MKNLFNIKDKVVVITGGTGVLGKAIALHLAEEGAKVDVDKRQAPERLPADERDGSQFYPHLPLSARRCPAGDVDVYKRQGCWPGGILLVPAGWSISSSATCRTMLAAAWNLCP